MSEYDSLVKTALRLIKKKGVSVIWRQITEGPSPDPDKPWLSGETITTDYSVDIVFLPVSTISSQYMSGTTVPEGAVVGYMPQVAFVPSIKDVIIRDNKQITINKFNEYKPAIDTILYELGLQT